MNHKLKLVGTVELPVRYKGTRLAVLFEVVDLDQANLLSGETAEHMRLITKLYALKSNSHEVDRAKVAEVPKGL